MVKRFAKTWQTFCLLTMGGVFWSFSMCGQSLMIAKLQYDGGGDWYANRTALPNLIRYANSVLHTDIAAEEATVHVRDNLFDYPYVYLTGHGHVSFSKEEAENLRLYLLSGGFLHIDDNYGLDKYIRREMKKVFPELDFIELPHSHAIYHQKYDFSQGLPKVHAHDGQRPQGLALMWEGRVLCFYSYESDLGNGWEDKTVHNDPDEIRALALQMGVNLLAFALSQP